MRCAFAALLGAAVLMGATGCGREVGFVGVNCTLLPPGMSVTPSSAAAQVGEQVTFVAGVPRCGGRSGKVRWTVPNGIVTVLATTDTSLVVRGTAEGFVTIRATSVEDPGLYADAQLQVGRFIGIPMAAFAVKGIVLDPGGTGVAGARVVLEPVFGTGGVPRDTLGSCTGMSFGPPRDTLVTAADGSFAVVSNTARFQMAGCMYAEVTPPAGSNLLNVAVSGDSIHSHPAPLDTVRMRIVLPRSPG